MTTHDVIGLRMNHHRQQSTNFCDEIPRAPGEENYTPTYTLHVNATRYGA